MDFGPSNRKPLQLLQKIGIDSKLQDMLGLYPRPSPKFSKNFMQGQDSIEGAVRAYVDAVRSRRFPAPEHSFT